MSKPVYHITVKNYIMAPCPVADHFFKEWSQAIRAKQMPAEFEMLTGNEAISYVKCNSIKDQGIVVRKNGAIIFGLNATEALQLDKLVTFFIGELGLKIK